MTAKSPMPGSWSLPIIGAQCVPRAKPPSYGRLPTAGHRADGLNYAETNGMGVSGCDVRSFRKL